MFYETFLVYLYINDSGPNLVGRPEVTEAARSYRRFFPLSGRGLSLAPPALRFRKLIFPTDAIVYLQNQKKGCKGKPKKSREL